ncbi:MAG: COX15/CtaA family protein [Bdellovibrionales bacterium]
MNRNNIIVLWLSVVCLMIYTMVLVGGITRLTESGLSIVEWRPFTGILPPTTDQEWQRVFDLYRQSPEYLKINAGMSLSDFQFIFFWEWFHRLLGRMVGVLFFVPLVIFQWRGLFKDRPGLTKKLWIGFFLGGSQGLLGWYMVQSGLVDRPDVSHFRLAAHLGLALFIFCYLFWIVLDLVRNIQPKKYKASPLFKTSILFIGLLSLQILWGAVTAGLKAGYGHNTFPDMSGFFFPPGAAPLEPFWLNFLESPMAVQFTHRTIGWTLLLAGCFLVVHTFRTSKSPFDRGPAMILAALLCLQFLLGVGVIILQVPIELATMHQSGAFFLF